MRSVRAAYGISAALAALAVWAQLALFAHRPVATPALSESVLAAFGAFRSLASEVVWFRADRLQEEGRYVELAQLARMLTMSEPHTPEVWSYAAWNLAYNVSVMMPTAEDRWRWVLAAMRLLRDDGLRLNPTAPELYRELAWLFELKLGTDIDSAAATYRAKWRELVADVAARNAWDELGMDAARMDEVSQRSGIDDRADPLFSAVYWASLGCGYAHGVDRQVLASIVRQSRMIFEKNRKEKTNEQEN